MLTSLFSIFDPSIQGWGQAKWVFLVVIFSMSWPFFVVNSSIGLTVETFFSYMFNSIEQNFKKVKDKIIILIGIFYFISSLVTTGLIPVIFSCPSHLSFNLSIALPLWLGGMIYSFKINKDKFLAHLTPLSCPEALIPALVLIESSSSLIRPVTLSVRLMANVMAGHLIMTLIGSGMSSSANFLPVFLGGVIQGGLVMFEFAISLVQAYVFTNLLSLYWKEAEHN